MTVQNNSSRPNRTGVTRQLYTHKTVLHSKYTTRCKKDSFVKKIVPQLVKEFPLLMKSKSLSPSILHLSQVPIL